MIDAYEQTGKLIRQVKRRVASSYRNYDRRPRRNNRILHDYKCIFIHIPKTGGSSIASVLNNLPNRTYPPICIPELYKHAKAVEVQRALGAEMWNEYFTFAIVRNPWDLMVSSYNWWLQKAYKWPALHPQIDKIKAMGSFEAFMQSKYGRFMINEFEGDDMFDWISNRNAIIVDYVGRFEALDDAWLEICTRLNVTGTPLTHLNQSERKHYRDYYSDKTKDIVYRRFRKTIDWFGYEY